MTREESVSPAAAPPAILDYAPPPDRTKIRNRRYITAALMLVMVLASMEATVTSTAMPTIIGQLHGLEHYAWVAAIYLLASTITMPLYGRLCDMLGRKRIIVTAITLFAVGSLLGSTAQSMPQLILYRAVQGLGAGGILPVALTILGDIFTLQERARIQGLFSAVWGSASLAGPWLGARLVNHLGWRSIFWVNLPFGFFGLAVLLWKYHDHEKPHAMKLDLAGAFTLAAGSVGLLAAVSMASEPHTALWWPALLLAAAIAALVAFVIIETRAEFPMMPPKLMLQRSIGPAMLGSFLLGLGVFALDTYVPLYVQGARGGNASAAAATVTPVMFAWAISSFFAAPLVVRWGFRKTAVLGACLALAGFVGLVGCVLLQAPQLVLTVVLAISGAGFGPASMAYLLGAQDGVSWQQRGTVTSSISFFRTIGGAVGVGLLGALFNVAIAPDLAAFKARGLLPAALLDPRQHASIPREFLLPAQQAIGHSLLYVFVGMVFCAIAQLAVSTMMSKKKHDHAVSRIESLEAMG